MAIVITNIGKERTLEYLFGQSTSEDLILKLYSNDTTPTNTDLVTDYTEVSGGGYTSITLNSSSWSISDGDASYPEQVWTFTGSAGAVYGYYIVNQTSNELLFAERFSGAPYTISSSGDIIRVTLNVNIL